YLAVELARLGHAITIFNGVAAPLESRGVIFRNHAEIREPGRLNAFDAAIVLGDPIGERLRRDWRATLPLILWLGHAAAEPAVQPLNRLAERESWTGFAFVSNWQQREYEGRFAVPRHQARVLRNAVSPA